VAIVAGTVIDIATVACYIKVVVIVDTDYLQISSFSMHSYTYYSLYGQ
jgi:hypothetical protein